MTVNIFYKVEGHFREKEFVVLPQALFSSIIYLWSCTKKVETCYNVAKNR